MCVCEMVQDGFVIVSKSGFVWCFEKRVCAPAEGVLVMLVLKRRKGQEIVIEGPSVGFAGGAIRIRIVQTSDGSCSLAFDAPETHRIRRAELPAVSQSQLAQQSSYVPGVSRGVPELLQVQG